MGPKIEIEIKPGGGGCGKCGGGGCGCGKDKTDMGDKILGVLGEQLAGVTDPTEVATILRDMADVIEEGGMEMDAGDEPMEGEPEASMEA